MSHFETNARDMDTYTQISWYECKYKLTGILMPCKYEIHFSALLIYNRMYFTCM